MSLRGVIDEAICVNSKWGSDCFGVPACAGRPRNDDTRTLVFHF